MYDEIYGKLMLLSKKVAGAIDRALRPIRIGMVIGALK